MEKSQIETSRENEQTIKGNITRISNEIQVLKIQIEKELENQDTKIDNMNLTFTIGINEYKEEFENQEKD